MSRSQWAWAVLVSAIVAALYAGLTHKGAKITAPKTIPSAQTESSQEVPVEQPEKLVIRRSLEDPAIEAQLPEPCPLTPVEYRYGRLMTNVLVERFDDNSTSRGVVVGRRRLQVNTDGAPNSYHSRVIKGDDDTTGAINIICNADTKIFKKEGDAKKPVVCRQGDASVTAEYAMAFAELRDKNWDDTDSGYSIQFDWKILGRGKRTRPDGPYAPCVKDDGFFVAKTRLRLRSSNDDCDGSIYPDSTSISTFVLPINWFADYQRKTLASPSRFSNFRVGDVVVAYRPAGNSQPAVWVYGVVGDAGPFSKLGEASIAFIQQIRGTDDAIKTYSAARKLDTDALRPKEIGFAVFEGSAAELKRDYSPANIKKVGEHRFSAWMGGALDKAQSRFLACAKKLELMPAPLPPPPS